MSEYNQFDNQGNEIEIINESPTPKAPKIKKKRRWLPIIIGTVIVFSVGYVSGARMRFRGPRYASIQITEDVSREVRDGRGHCTYYYSTGNR